MEKNTDILNEIQSISPVLASLRDTNVFEVPDGYFNQLSENVKERVISAGLSELGMSQTVPQQVPEGYFDNLSASILQKIKAEKIAEQPDSLPAGLPASMREINVFVVPQGYFESLPEQIMSKIRPAAVVIPLYKRPFFRHAVAAMIAVVLFVGAFFAITNQSPGEQNGFSVVSKATVPDRSALKYNSQKSFEAGIASLTDEQIITYLQAHGTILDNDMLIENVDASGLPDLQDYLLYDDALDEYLEKISMNGL